MKTVLITGANKSIGFEIARQMAKQDYYVYIGCRDMTKGEAAVKALQNEGLTNTEAVEIDVSKPESVAKASEMLGEKLEALDVLINNAGISGGMPQTALTLQLSTFKDVFDTNFFGVINVTQAFIGLLKKSTAPRIVNVTSGLASLTLHSDPAWQFYQVKSAAYGPSKTALNAYTIALAYELKDTTFKVNAVDPGYTATDFNQHSGPKSVADAASYIVKYANIDADDADGPSGKFFSIDNNPETGESPW